MDSNLKWRVVAMLFLVGGLNYVDRTSIAAVFPLLKADLHASDMQLGAIGSVFLWSYALGAPFAGLLADRVSRSRLIVISLAAWSLITTLCGLVTDIQQLLVLRFLLGFAECLYVPAAIPLLADHHGTDTRGTAMGIHLAGLNLAVVVGGTLSGYLGEHAGWRAGLILLGVTGLVLSVIAHFVLRDGPPVPKAVQENQDVWSDFRAIVRVPTYWVIVGENTLASIGLWMFFNWMPLYFRETFGMGLTAAGFNGTVYFQVAAVIGVSLGGVISDRFTRGGPARRMFLMAGFYLLAAPFLLIFLGKPALLPLTACIFISSLLRTLGQANEGPILCDVLTPRRRALALGIMSCCTMTSGGFGVFAAGYLKQDFGLGGVFAGVSGIIFLAGLLALYGALRLYPRDLAKMMPTSASVT